MTTTHDNIEEPRRGTSGDGASHGDGPGRDVTGQPGPGALPEGMPQEAVAYLEGLIGAFNESATRLRTAYDVLQHKFDLLNTRLEETNHELTKSLREKDRLSNHLTGILDSFPSGVLVIDTVGVVTLFNPGAEAITGISAADAVGRHYCEVMGADEPDDRTPLGVLNDGIRVSNLEKTLSVPSGPIPVGFSTAPLVGDSGTVAGAIEIFMDLRRIKSLEAELSRMDKLAALGQMAATVAHKIRNPLGGIAGFASLMRLDFGENEHAMRMVAKILDGVDKINAIITNLLAYARRLTLKPREVDLREQMRVIVTSMRDEEPDTTGSIAFTVDEPCGPVSAEIDVNHFGFAMRNICRNACEAYEGEGTVDITVFSDRSDFFPAGELAEALREALMNTGLARSGMPCAMVTVIDSGSGLRDEDRANLFMPFYTTKESGTGLGLAVARKIIEEHHGEIAIVGREGAGTAVGVMLPRRYAQ